MKYRLESGIPAWLRLTPWRNERKIYTLELRKYLEVGKLVQITILTVGCSFKPLSSAPLNLFVVSENMITFTGADTSLLKEKRHIFSTFRMKKVMTKSVTYTYKPDL